MHGLHLIKFLDRPSGSSKIAQENSETVRQHCNQTEKLVSQIYKPQSHTKIESSKTTKWPSVQKCISQIFGRLNYDIPRSKISKRYHSFLLHKRKVLSNSSFHGKGKHIKNNKEESKTRRKKCLPRSGSVSDKIEVLFKSKNWKSKRRRPLTLNSKDICKYAIHYNSKSSYDLNYDRKKNRNNKFCCRLHIPQVKRRRSKTFQTAVASCDNKHYRQFYSDHTIQNTQANLKNSTCHHHAHQLGPTYNVIDFPNAACFVPSNSSKYEPVTLQFETQQMAVTTSFDNSKGGGDNAASVPVQGTCSVPILHPKNHLKSHPRSQVFAKYKNSSRASKVPACPVCIVKSIKFILFSLSVIIWFPCILIMSLLWIISYPVRPNEAIKTVIDIEDCKTELCQNDDQDFWHSIYTCVAGVVKKLLRLYEAMFSLIKNTNGKRNCTRLVTSRSTLLRRNGDKQYPNPRKKYKLFYDNDRGWVMKPIKLRKEQSFEKAVKTCREELPEDTLKNNEPKINSNKYENEEGERTSKCPIKDSQVTKKESQDIYTQESENMKSNYRKNQGISRNRQNENNKAKVSDCVCDQMKKTAPKDVNCVCESVQTEYQPNNCKSKNIAVYSSFQKSSKFVTFDERIQPDSKCLCSTHVLDNICPVHLRKCCSLKSTCTHHKRNIKMNNKKMAPSLPVIQRRCLCNCKFNKAIDGLNRKYAVSGKLRNQHRSRKVQKKDIKQKPRPKRIKKFIQFCRKFRQKAAIIIKEADRKVWNCDNCEDIFVQTLRKRPWVWVHRRCPKFYPYFIAFCKFYENLAYAMLYVCTACIWCPVFCWCYLCCNLFCRCML